MKKTLLFLLFFSSFLAFYANAENDVQNFVFKPKALNFEIIKRTVTTDRTYDIKLSDLFEYPEFVPFTEDLSSKLTVISADESLIQFEKVEYVGWQRNTIISLKQKRNVEGSVKITVKILYNGVESVNNDFYVLIEKLVLQDDVLSIEPDDSKEVDVLLNDRTIVNKSKLQLEIIQAPNLGMAEVVFKKKNDIIEYTADADVPNYSFDTLVYRVTDTENSVSKTAKLIINIHANPYVSKLLEYLPAPGQFINKPEFGMRSTAEKMIKSEKGKLVSLGGWGGYIVVGFDQPITNNPKNPYGVDFTVCGNAFFANYGGAWSEPATVMVMKDINGNGLPDDGEWYELAGSDYHFSTTIKNVEMTYYNPKKDERFFVPWKTNKGHKGVMASNRFHEQSYFPDSFDFGTSIDSLTYFGNYTQLTLDLSQPNYIEVLKPPVFGYADLRPPSKTPTRPLNPYYEDENGKPADGFDLNWAVDKLGNHVQLDTVHFVKIYATTQADAGWLGEVSPEVGQVVITTPDPNYIPKDYYVHALNVTQLQVQKGTTCQYEGLLFKNGIPVQEGTDSWTSTNTAVATIDNNGLLTGIENGKTVIKYQKDPNVPADSMLIDVVTIKDLILELEGNSSLANDTVRLTQGETVFITAQCVDNREEENGPDGGKRNRFVYETYSWTLSDPTVGTIDRGIFTGEKPGETTLTVQPISKPNLNKRMVVIVKEIPSINLKQDTIFIKKEEDKQCVLKIEDMFERVDKASVLLKSVSSSQLFLAATIEKNELKFQLTDNNNRSSDLSDAELTIEAEYHNELHSFKLVIKDQTTTGVQVLKIEDKFKLFPNPVEKNFTVNNNGKIEIFSLGGAKVLEITDYESGQVIDISSCSQGVYFVRITNKEGVYTRRMIKR